MRHRNIIGPQVRRLRDKRGWSQEQLAAKLQLAGLDISRSSLSKIESGEQAVFDFQVLYFRRVFKADSDDLYEPFDPRKPDFHQRVTRFMGTQAVIIGTFLPTIFQVFENCA
jgi:transcriptional regulator with XRE-family HTH domain